MTALRHFGAVIRADAGIMIPPALSVSGTVLGSKGSHADEVATVESNKENEYLVPLSFNFDIKTGTETGNRQAGYQIEDATGKVVKRVLSPTFSKKSELYGICGFSGNASASTSRTIQVPLDVFPLPKGWKFQLLAIMLTGDEFTIKRMYYEYVKELPLALPPYPGPNVVVSSGEPAAAAAGKALRMLGMAFTLTTSAQTGSRWVGYEFKEESGNTITEVLTEALLASAAYRICAYPGAPSVLNGLYATIPFPTFALAAGYKFEGIKPFVKSEDVLSAFTTTYEYIPA
jgi:hypothetical protein